MTVFFSTTPDPSSQEEGTTIRHVASLHYPGTSRPYIWMKLIIPP